MFKKVKTLALAGVLTMVMSTTALGAMLPTDKTFSAVQSDGSEVQYYTAIDGQVYTNLPQIIQTVTPGASGNTVRYDINKICPEGPGTDAYAMPNKACMTVSNVLRESVKGDTTIHGSGAERVLYAKGTVTITFSGQYYNSRLIYKYNKDTVRIENGRLIECKDLDYRTLKPSTQTIFDNIGNGSGGDADQTETLDQPGMYNVGLGAMTLFPDGSVFHDGGVQTLLYIAGSNEDISYVAPTTETATETSINAVVNGNEVNAYGYNITGDTYMKLRDIAYMVNGSAKQFDVIEAPGMNRVTIKTYGSPAYTAVGGEMASIDSGTQTAAPTTKDYAIDGSPIEPLTYSINGAEYVKVTDIAKIVDFNATTDSSSNTLNIDTTTGFAVNPVVNVPSPITVSSTVRLAGNDRYQTAVAISKNGWSQSDNVLLTDGEDFHGALVGSSLAYLKNAPILLTPPDSLNSDTSAEIARLGAKTIYIIGSHTQVSQAVEDTLKQTYNVIRIGDDTYDATTALDVANEVQKIKPFDTCILATDNFPDALAMAPFSAKNTMPILFVAQHDLDTPTEMALRDWGIKNVIIVGGLGVISANIEARLTETGITFTRLAGQDRYDTDLEILKHFAPQGGYTSIAIATGENYPDALTGAVLAAKNNMTIVLVQKDSVESNTTDFIKSCTLSKTYIFGGTAVVSASITGN